VGVPNYAQVVDKRRKLIKQLKHKLNKAMNDPNTTATPEPQQQAQAPPSQNYAGDKDAGKAGWGCPDCHKRNVRTPAWVDANTKKFIENAPGLSSYCEDCGEHHRSLEWQGPES
jgi:hypothetical protein